MGQEMAKSMRRRLHEPTFHQRIFVGDVLDVGAGDDGFAHYRFLWPRVTSVREWQHEAHRRVIPHRIDQQPAQPGQTRSGGFTVQ